MHLTRLVSHPLFVTSALQIVLAYEWLSAGWGKISKGTFVSTIGNSFARFEEGNPHGWYVENVLRVAKDYPTLFGMLVQWGELLTGIGLVAALALYNQRTRPTLKRFAQPIALLSLAGGMFMNLNFYFAAGWANASTGGFNALLFWAQAILFVAWLIPARVEKKRS